MSPNSSGLDRVLKRLLARHRGGADLAGRDFGVLVADRVDHVRRRDPQCRHPVGVHPDPHRVLQIGQHLGLAHALNPGQRIADVDRGIVGQEHVVIGAVRRRQRHHQKHVGGGLLRHHARGRHLGRQGRHRLRHPVLHVDRGDVRIGSHLERDIERIAAIVRGCGRHVEHVVHPVHLRLDRRGHGIFDGFGAGAGIGGRHVDHRRADIGELRHRQHQIADCAHHRQHQRDHERQLGPVDEDRGKHGLSSRLRLSPSTPEHRAAPVAAPRRSPRRRGSAPLR